MHLLPGNIRKDCLVRDIVSQDYRTATVFDKFGIGYCCGGNWSLEATCTMKGIELEPVLEDLKKATRTLQVSSALPFEKWNLDFLTDYIVNIHHVYLKQTLPELQLLLTRFVEEHARKYPSLIAVLTNFRKLFLELPPHLEEEETIIFSYIRQVSHAYESNDSYAGLLVKTLRKPIDQMMRHEHDTVSEVLNNFRVLTQEYTPPEKACTSHRVAFSKLKELDHDLAQHIYLENEILFPKVLHMENELLNRWQ